MSTTISMSTTVEHTKACMGFDSRVMLDAIQGLEKSRSASFLTSIVRRKDEIERSKLRTVWDIKPIDFSVKLYQPRPLPRNSRESMMKDHKSSAVIIEERSERKRTIDPSVPKLHLPSLLMVKEEDSRPIFHRKCRPPSPQTAEIHFIREGKFKPDQYVTQSVSIHKRDMFRQLENFRQFKKYGIEDFETTSESDPGNLKFKRMMIEASNPELSTTKQIAIRTCQSEPLPQIQYRAKWEPQLHLPRSAYKKGRSAHSALMQRIEKKLGWQNEREKIGDLQRPDIFDYKIKDWCDVTTAPDEKAGPFALG